MSGSTSAGAERIVLVGFMCSGKTTVGRRLAAHLDWDFIDFDETIERRREMRIAEIFRRHGEGFFRDLEAQLTRELQDRTRVVLAPGGGWVTQPDLVRRLRDDSLIVWLRVSPETVLERHRSQTETVRPLLATDDPMASIRSILEERLPLYRTADLALDTDERSPDTLVREIVERLQEQRPDIPRPLTDN